MLIIAKFAKIIRETFVQYVKAIIFSSQANALKIAILAQIKINVIMQPAKLAKPEVKVSF